VEPGTFLLRVGPIVDNENGYGIQGATIYMRMGDQWMINKTDLAGSTHFRLLLIEEETDVILNISRDGYQPIEHHNVILPDGKLKYLIPGLNKVVRQIDTEGEGEEEDSPSVGIDDPMVDEGGDKFPLGVVIVILVLLALVAGIIFSIVCFRKMKIEKEAIER